MHQKLRRKGNFGFTLVELLSALIFMGIISAIAAPNLLGIIHRTKVNNALEKLTGAIRETQRLAMRNGRNCRLDINPNNNILSSSDSQCLLNTRHIDGDVLIRSNFPGTMTNIIFSNKGTTTRMGTMVLSSNFTNTQKCFVISLGLGIMRTGKYSGSKTGSVSAQHCQ